MNAGEPGAAAISPEQPVAVRRSLPRAAMIKKACDEIVLTAKEFRLPEQFLLRLIWQESRFNPKAVSSAGAKGIAQFMTATAQWRGLNDPFDWPAAIQHSGRWLGELRRQFGNLGLAAAAYNAGPGRVQDWLAGSRELPKETRQYVRIVTGRNAEDWIGGREPGDRQGSAWNKTECPPHDAAAAFPIKTDAGADVRAQAAAHRSAAPKPPLRAWALQLVGDRSSSVAMRQYAGMRQQFVSILGSRAPVVVPRRVGGRRPTYWYQVRVSEVSRQSATTLCDRLKSAGGHCLVIQN